MHEIGAKRRKEESMDRTAEKGDNLLMYLLTDSPHPKVSAHENFQNQTHRSIHKNTHTKEDSLLLASLQPNPTSPYLLKQLTSQSLKHKIDLSSSLQKYIHRCQSFEQSWRDVRGEEKRILNKYAEEYEELGGGEDREGCVRVRFAGKAGEMEGMMEEKKDEIQEGIPSQIVGRLSRIQTELLAYEQAFQNLARAPESPTPPPSVITDAGRFCKIEVRKNLEGKVQSMQKNLSSMLHSYDQMQQQLNRDLISSIDSRMSQILCVKANNH